MKVKVYKLIVSVIDFDRIGEEGILDAIENTRYPNRCISPRVEKVDVREVDWLENHPLNNTAECGRAFEELFE